MPLHELAGKPVPAELLIDTQTLLVAYHERKPDAGDVNQRVAFGTSGHRGCALDSSFNEDHIVAICQALVEYRDSQGVRGPLFMGMDTHALSEPAHETAIEVFAANGVELRIHADGEYTPTPVISHSILTANGSGRGEQADGVVITPSHNPPRDGGFKYNPPHGGPADTIATAAIETRANELLEDGLAGVKRMAFADAMKAASTQEVDLIRPYVEDRKSVV